MSRWHFSLRHLSISAISQLFLTWFDQNLKVCSWDHLRCQLSRWHLSKQHMAGSSQQQHFFAAGCVFSHLAIAVIFYPVIKSSWNFFAWCVHTRMLNLRAKISFVNIIKIIQKSSKLRVWPNFRTVFNIIAKLMFALKFHIWVLQY